MFDSQGASIQESLPQSTRMTLNAKTAIAFPIYIVGLVLIIIILALQPLILLTPIAQIPTGYAIAILVGGALYKIRGDGRAVAITITGNISLVFVAGIVGTIPLVDCGLTLIFTGLHTLSIAVQVGFAFLNAIVANRYVSRLLND